MINRVDNYKVIHIFYVNKIVFIHKLYCLFYLSFFKFNFNFCILWISGFKFKMVI